MHRNYIFYIAFCVVTFSLLFYVEQILNGNFSSFFVKQIIRTPHIGIFVL